MKTSLIFAKRILCVVGVVVGIIITFDTMDILFNFIDLPSSSFEAGTALIGIVILAGVWVAVIVAGVNKLIERWKERQSKVKSLKKICLPIMGAALIAVATIGTTGCATTVNAGSIGLVIHQTGKDRGVQSYTMVTGRVWYNPWTEDIVEYPVTIQTVSWTKDTHEGNPVDESITFTNKEGMSINADISASYQLDQNKAPYFYSQFKKDHIQEFTDTWFRNVVRNAFNDKAGAYTVEQIMGDNAPLLRDVLAAVNAQTLQYGITVNELGFINAPRPPQSVIDTINSKNQAEQLALQKENEVAQAKADAQKAVAEAQGEADAARIRAQGQADANKMLNASLDSNLLAWKQLEKWDGVLPQVTGGGNGLLLSLQKKGN